MPNQDQHLDTFGRFTNHGVGFLLLQHLFRNTAVLCFRTDRAPKRMCSFTTVPDTVKVDDGAPDRMILPKLRAMDRRLTVTFAKSLLQK